MQYFEKEMLIANKFHITGLSGKILQYGRSFALTYHVIKLILVI